MQPAAFFRRLAGERATLGASVQLATTKQVVDLGPVIVLNLGQWSRFMWRPNGTIKTDDRASPQEEILAKQCVEIRILRLHHGQQEQFVARFRERLLPLHQQHGIEVVTWGLSLHDKGSFYVIRAYPSVEARQASLDALFGSDEWLMNQEEEVWGMIESYNTCVVEADEALVGAMRAGLVGAPEQNAIPPGWG